MVSTLSAMVIKSATAHIFHVGDSRIYRLRGKAAGAADQRPPRVDLPGPELPGPRAGFKPQLEIDYQTQQVEQRRHLRWPPTARTNMSGRARDGPHHPRRRRRARRAGRRRQGPARQGPSRKAAATTSTAQRRARRRAAAPRSGRCCSSCRACRCRPSWRPGRSSTATPSCAKCRAAAAAISTSRHRHRTPARSSSSRCPPSIDLGGYDPAYLERFLTRRVDRLQAHQRARAQARMCRPASATMCTCATEYIDGQTLAQCLMVDNPRPRASRPGAAWSSSLPKRLRAPSTGSRCCTRLRLRTDDAQREDYRPAPSLCVGLGWLP